MDFKTKNRCKYNKYHIDTTMSPLPSDEIHIGKKIFVIKS
jgi:hypothetical protein